MFPVDRELLARLSAVNANLASVNQNMGEVALRMLATWQRHAELDSSDLRAASYGLLSLAAELTTLGADMAQRADGLDQKKRPDGRPQADENPCVNGVSSNFQLE